MLIKTQIVDLPFFFHQDSPCVSQVITNVRLSLQQAYALSIKFLEENY